MMREIKFRGKQIDNGDWIVGYYAYKDLSEEHFIVVPTFDSQGSSNRPQYFTDYLVEPGTVGQCISFKDRKGNDIYEGDIIRYLSGGNYYQSEVFYGEDCGCYLVKEQTVMLLDHAKRHAEVIGNIYDNPELLEATHESK